MTVAIFSMIYGPDRTDKKNETSEAGISLVKTVGILILEFSLINDLGEWRDKPEKIVE